MLFLYTRTPDALRLAMVQRHPAVARRGCCRRQARGGCHARQGRPNTRQPALDQCVANHRLFVSNSEQVREKEKRDRITPAQYLDTSNASTLRGKFVPSPLRGGTIGSFSHFYRINELLTIIFVVLFLNINNLIRTQKRPRHESMTHEPICDVPVYIVVTLNVHNARALSRCPPEVRCLRFEVLAVPIIY